MSTVSPTSPKSPRSSGSTGSSGSTPRTPSYAVVGASLAGARAAQALRARGFAGRVLLVGAEPHPPYDRPPLSKGLLAGTATPADVALEPEERWAEQGIELVLGQPVVALDPSRRELELADGSRLPADQVLLCTGGAPRRLPVPGGDLPGVFTLRTLEDSQAIHERLLGGARVVVVGAGFIGAEVAASARQLGCEVTLVEVADVPLWRVLGHEMGRIYAQVHRDEGVRLLTGVGVQEVRGDSEVREVVLTDGSVVPANVVVVGVGIEPSTGLAAAIGARVDNGIVVDELCRTTVPGVYAAGDVANHPSALLGGRVRLEHWRNAQNQGAAAAASMLGVDEPFHEVPWFWSDQYGINLQVSGHPHPEDTVVWRGSVEDRRFSAFYLREGALRAVVAMNRPGDARAGMDLIAAGAVLGTDVLADESVNLKAAAREAREARLAGAAGPGR